MVDPTSDRARTLVELAYAIGVANEDDEAMAHTLPAGSQTYGSFEKDGTTLVGDGPVVISEPYLRYCTGNAEACWLIRLDEVDADPIGTLMRIKEWYA